jgi:murein DD-endopeptidase MepM/ murein hydrolase activator NlpD
MRSACLLLVLAGCASAPAPKLSVDEAFGSKRHAKPVVDPKASPRFGPALEAFQAEAKSARSVTPAGAPMPGAHEQAWNAMLDEIDLLLSRPVASTSSLELARARLALESELETDRGAFGDVPTPLAERIPSAMKRLSQTLTHLAEKPKHAANPHTFLWPVRPVVLTSPWGTRFHPIYGEYRFHAGVDLLADLAQPVRAAAAGTIVFAGWNGAHGKQLEVQHDGHVSTRYSHLQSWLVEPGTQVKKGDIIGLAGDTGTVTGPHLHFELLKDGESVDPEELMPAPGTDGPLLTQRPGSW